VYGDGTGSVFVFGALLCRPIQSQRSKWAGSISFPESQAIFGTFDHFDILVSRVYDHGQLFSIFSRIVNIVRLICWLGAASGQIGPFGDMPQREIAASDATEV
jgi:hypothetical protein